MNGPLITMTAITGKPTKNDIFSYMKSLKNSGIDKAMLYPRSGCEIEYLSESWFDTIGNFIDSAKALDMGIWLYDDFNWPSGDAGGRVTKIPEYRLKAIKVKGESLGEITCKSKHNAGLFGEKFFPDLLSPEAVDYFIKCTHEEYFKRFSQDFGSVILGIFTDEPSIGYCCKDGCIPYYEGIDTDYFNLCHRDFYEDIKKEYNDFYLNVTTVISNRFKHCYIEKLRDWCDSHGILMTGHLLCDNEVFWTVQHNGNLLKNLSSFSLPGVDEIETCFEDDRELSLFGVIEYASGKNGAMAELFALGPCDMTYAKKRAMIYFASCFKVDNYFLAISHMDMRGNLKVTDYYSDFSLTQPDFSGMTELSTEARKAAVLAKKDFTPDVYIRYPYRNSAKNLSGWFDYTNFCSLINQLTYKQIQWKFIDDETPSAPIIEVGENGELTLDGKTVDITKINGKTVLTDKNGDTPLGVFVRRFDDGELAVINLFGKEDEYFIDGKCVFLKKHDVYLSTDSSTSLKPVLSFNGFTAEYKNENLIRTMHLNSQPISKIHVDCDTEISFAVRNDTEAYLNGDVIACDENSDTLPFGMKNLYKCSRKLILKKGENVIKTDLDFKYLPSVLIMGNFSYEIRSGEVCEIYIKERKSSYNCGERIYDFGKIDFTKKIDVLPDTEYLEIVGANLLTEAYIDNKLLGRRAFSPYLFSIDKSTCKYGAELKIVQYSSIAPIFGDVDFWDKSVTKCGWRGTPSPKNQGFGFDEVNLLKV